MRGMRILALAAATGAAALSVGIMAAPAANASGRPCGSASSETGTGSLGSQFTLKSMYDDDGATPGVVVGEEFEIAVPAGETWAITFADNGTVFFSGTQVSTAAGIRVQEMTPAQSGSQNMTASAVNQGNGETVSGGVHLDPAPAKCGN